MNFYKRHLGDYAKDCGHLSMLEHGAYTLLLDRYYTAERPVMKSDAYRITHARSKEERAAVDTVLSEFFEDVNGQMHNRRADEEIEKASAKADANRANGGKGGRPRKTQSVIPLETHGETQSVPTNNLSQTPDSRLQKTEAATTEDIPRPVAIAVLLRANGLTTTGNHPTVRAWADTGHSDETLLLAMSIAKKRRADAGDANPVNPGYLDAILNDPAALAGGTREAKSVDRWRSSDEGITRKGREIGVPPRSGESYASYAERIAQRLSEGAAHAA